MSSPVSAKHKKKTDKKTSINSLIGLITLAVGVIAIILTIVLIKNCDNVPDEPTRPVPGKYLLESMVSQQDGVERSAKEILDVYKAAGYTMEHLITIELREDGVFFFESDFDMMISYEGTYTLDGTDITMEADGTEMTGTADGTRLRLTDAEGQVMTFVREDR